MSNLPSTQEHLDIEDIREDLVILRNSNVSLILETSSLNFDLLSEPEQEARIQSFANLLNSLNFTVQIVIRTERADVNDYLGQLTTLMTNQPSQSLKRQMEIYIKFIQNLTVKTEILNKRFFVVITTNYMPQTKTTSLLDSIFGKGKKIDPYVNLEKAKNELMPRRDFLTKQLKKMGIKSVQLNNDQLLQLFYNIYDPDKVGVKTVELSESGYTSGIVNTNQPERSENEPT